MIRMFPKISEKLAGTSAVAASLIMFFNIIILSSYAENFQLFSSWLSALGANSNGHIFNSLVVLSAVFLLPFGIYMYRALGRKRHIKIIFVMAGVFLALTGIFSSGFSLHKPIAYAFFAFAALSLLTIGWNLKNKFGAVTIILVIWCLLGTPFINPFIETVQAFVAIAWLFSAGILAARGYMKAA